MKKIALLTWTTYENYGTYLQWFALSKTIETNGYTCHSIDYHPIGERRNNLTDLLLNDFPSFFNYTIHKVFEKIVFKNPILNLNSLNLRKTQFLDFRNKYFTMTKFCFTASDLFKLNEDYNAFICGSDQIWNPHSFNTHFFLDFVNNGSKKIAYAPSIGAERIKDSKIIKEMGKMLSDFSSISVREQSGKTILEKAVSNKISVVLDPTLLLSKEEWLEISDKEYKTESKYILCYFLGNNEKYWKWVNELSKKTNLPLLIIPVYKKDFSRSSMVPDNIGPSQFITLISNSEYICTDSFHGTIFSILFEKKIFSFKRFSRKSPINQNTRLFNLLNLFGLEDRVFNSRKKMLDNVNTEIDYNNVKLKLENEKNKSLIYLKEAITNSLSATQSASYSITNTCCGCGACRAVCPQNAIKISENCKGFFTAEIDNTLCINCGKCRKVCPFYTSSAKLIDLETSAFAVKSTNADVLLSSSSGGISYEINNYYMAKNSAVGGCYYDSKNKRAVTDLQINDKANIDIKKYQGSKYLQSNFTDIFDSVLSADEGVITGTPCQISALHNYLLLKNRRDKYLLVDLICHGVPSYLLWDKYIEEKKYLLGSNEDIDVKFRNKVFGWNKKTITLLHSNKALNISEKKDLFYTFFESGNCYAESCYECNYRCSSNADIRIGDYWGQKYHNEKNGMSIALPLTKKGSFLLQDLQDKNHISMTKGSINDYFNSQQTKNKYKPLEYEGLLNDLKSNITLAKLRKKYCKAYYFRNMLKPIYKVIFKFVRGQ